MLSVPGKVVVRAILARMRPKFNGRIIVQARRFSLLGHIARMPGETDAKKILTTSPLENWRRPPVCPRTTWMKTVQQDLKSNNLSLNEAVDVAQNRPLWRLMS